jgi:outer membrane protein assembly factor BamD (BamD/ComL family)
VNVLPHRACQLALALALASAPAHAAPAHSENEPAKAQREVAADDPLAKYFNTLEQMKLIDTESGTLETLRRELAVGETLLHDGAYTNAAVALYAIVKSPRYTAFTDFVEYQNAQYDLAVALSRAGSYGAALEVIDEILRRGPAAPYWGPAHRRAVDIAIETRDHAGILARLEAIKQSEPIPTSAAGERAYLRGRAFYDAGKLAAAEGELQQISKKSRLYSSSVYLRGVIRARRNQYKEAAEAMCEIAATPDTDKLTFVVDDRYFTVKDLARLGLGRIAHEQGEYDDAYYHYFQIPEDSAYLPDALFEAAWSMYQKRELATSRDLVHDFLKDFPTSPLWPEASLLAGYVELADCKFTESQDWYDKLVARLQPVVDEIDKVRKDPEQRRALFAKVVTRFHEIKQTGEVAGGKPGTEVAKAAIDDVEALLRLDPKFLRLNDAVTGAAELANSAPQVVHQWQSFGAQVAETRVGKVATEKTAEQEQLADANAVVEDLRRLGRQVLDQRAEIARAMREHQMPADAGAAELQRLDQLFDRVQAAQSNAVAAADRAGRAATAKASPGLRPLLEADLAEARRLDKASHALAKKLADAGERLSQQAIDRLYDDTRRVLDKAKLGKVDAVIGQKRKLDIEVQDLAAGRFPEELIGRLWNASMIGDDEEYWPFQGEYWSDEYEGFR